MTGLRRVLSIALVIGLLIPVSSHAVRNNSKFALIAADVELTVDFGNGTVISTSGLTATNVLNLTESLYQVDSTWYGDRAYVNAIDGAYKDSSHGWQYWVNGEYAAIACNLYILQDGDSVLWNRTISGFQNTAEPDITLMAGGVIITIAAVVFLALLYRDTRKRDLLR